MSVKCLPAILGPQMAAPIFHAQYDWTAGAPDNGNDWRKFRVVPRPHPLRPSFCPLFNRGGSRRAFRLPGAGGDHFHCTVEPSPGHIRCRNDCDFSCDSYPCFHKILAAILVAILLALCVFKSLAMSWRFQVVSIAILREGQQNKNRMGASHPD